MPVVVYAKGLSVQVFDNPGAPLPGLSIQRMPLNPDRVVSLSIQFQRDRYNRFQRALCLTASSISLEFHCTSLTTGGGAVPFMWPKYGWVVNGVERATSTPTAGSSVAVFSGVLGNEADSATHQAWIVAYNASGQRVPDWVLGDAGESFPRYGFSIDRNGQARNDPNVVCQSGSYKWSKDMEFGRIYHDLLILPKSDLVPMPRPLPKRDVVGTFTSALRYDNPSRVDLARVPLVPNTDVHTADRHYPCVTDRGITVTENEQGYRPPIMFEMFPRLPLFDGERGVCTAPYTLHVKLGRFGKIYHGSPWSVGVIDSTGKKTTFIGLRHKVATYHETPVQSVTDPRIEVVGDWDPSIPIDRRYPLESWFMVWDPRSLLVDLNAPPINGEPPHLPYTLPSGEVISGPRYFVGDRWGRVLEVRTDGKNRATPHKVREWITGLSDPWGGTALDTQNTFAVGERGAHAIREWSMDVPNTMVSTWVASPGAASVGAVGPIPDRRFNWNAGQTNGTIAARAFDCVAPEGLDYLDGWLYFGSMAQGQVRKMQRGGPVVVVCAPTINTTSVGSYFVNLAVGDGTFGPRGTVFVCTFFNTEHGRPSAFLPDGTPWPWSAYCYGVDRGSGGTWNGGHYQIAVAQKEGRLVCTDAAGGVDYFCKADAYDGPAPDYAKAELGWKDFRMSGEDIRHGPYLVNRNAQALPTGSQNMNYFVNRVAS